MSRKLYIRNFEQYQHYKTRRPPWVKLYREILDDRTLMQLPAEARFVAVGLILLASENDRHSIENDSKWLGERLHMEPRRVRECVKALHKSRFLASTALASRKQSATPEVETEEETETNQSNGSVSKDEARDVAGTARAEEESEIPF